jgi:hypothetical protein
MIRRTANPTENFTIVTNAAICDADLSWSARGLLIYLLSKPAHWSVHARQLAKESPNAKRDKIYNLLAELKSAGYVKTTQVRQEDGTLGEFDYEVYDIPFGWENDLTGSGFTGYGETGNRYFRQEERIYREKELKIEKDIVHSSEILEKSRKKRERHPYSPEFLAIWLVYPRKTNKTTAGKQYEARIREGISPSELLTAAENYALLRRNADPQFTMMLSTFLGPNERWRDYLPGGAGLAEGRPGSGGTINILQRFLDGEDQ